MSFDRIFRTLNVALWRASAKLSGISSMTNIRIRPQSRPRPQAGQVTYAVPSTERLLNAKLFSRLPPKSVARQEALWQDTLREGSVRALCQEKEYNSGGLTCHLKRSSPRPQFYRSSALFSSLEPITVLECPLGNGLDLLVIADKSRPATTNRLILCIFRTFFRRFAEQGY